MGSRMGPLWYAALKDGWEGFGAIDRDGLSLINKERAEPGQISTKCCTTVQDRSLPSEEVDCQGN